MKGKKLSDLSMITFEDGVVIMGKVGTHAATAKEIIIEDAAQFEGGTASSGYQFRPIHNNRIRILYPRNLRLVDIVEGDPRINGHEQMMIQMRSGIRLEKTLPLQQGKDTN